MQVEYTFDDKSFRHFMNGFEVVMHCHHYLTLTTKLAEDFSEFGGIRILNESVEDAIRPLLDDYVQKNQVPAGAERLAVGARFYELMGMGLMSATGDAAVGQATLTRSHVDQGWLAKFGPADRTLNYFTCGFLAAVFACAFDRPARSYQVVETAGLAKGDATGKFEIQAR
jgi:hypothetical protein